MNKNNLKHVESSIDKRNQSEQIRKDEIDCRNSVEIVLDSSIFEEIQWLGSETGLEEHLYIGNFHAGSILLVNAGSSWSWHGVLTNVKPSKDRLVCSMDSVVFNALSREIAKKLLMDMYKSRWGCKI